MDSFSKKKSVIDENIKANDEILTDTYEKRAAHILEKSDLLMTVDKDDIRTVYNKFYAEPLPSCDYIEENANYHFGIQKSIKLYDSLYSVENIVGDSANDFFQKKDTSAFLENTIVYLKNSLSDIAYSKFSKIIKDARVLYSDSFVNVCEEVYYSHTPYCILPLENSDDGRLSSFHNMMRKYELKTVLTCNVESPNDRVTKFALLMRDFEYINCPEHLSDGVYLEIGWNGEAGEKLYNVLGAADYFGYELNKVNSVPTYYSEKEYYFDVVFKGKGELNKFLYWLELEVPRYEILGLYTHIKTL